MINAIRADLYRLFHTKGFYITQFLLILFVVISVAAEATGNVGVNTSEGTTEMQSHLQFYNWDSYQTFIAFSSMASFLIYFCLPLLVMIAGYDLVHKSYKNQLTSGVSRLQYFGSKYLIFIVVTVLQFLFYYTSAFLTAAVKNGIGTAPQDFWMNALQTIGIQFIAFHAIFIVGLCILIITFSNVAGILSVILLPLIINILSAFFNIGWLKYVDFQYGINYAWIRDLPDFSWLVFLCFSLGVIIVMSYIAYQAFRNKSL